MKYYQNKAEFEGAIRTASDILGISPAIIEKDYFVTLLLGEIVKKVPGILFKGGTCLSKCFGLIDRFSEDIDLTLDESHFTQSHKRKANKEILKICDELGFVVRNRGVVEKHSHGAYNCYEIEYPRCQDDKGLIPYIKLELVFIQKAFPSMVASVNSLLGNALATIEGVNGAIENELAPFHIRVQSLERTCIDKVFAICDYYLRKESLRQSRHIYDIYKIYPKLDLALLKELIPEVRRERKKNKTSLSAADGCNVNAVIKEFIANNFFMEDYDKITLSLLSKKIPYNEAIKTLTEISALGLFT